MTKEITTNGSTAVITTDIPMEQTIVIEPKPLDSVSFMGAEVQTSSVWIGLMMVLVLVILTRKILKR
jgi:hypothetical protein